jgi:hypothetical protein
MPCSATSHPSDFLAHRYAGAMISRRSLPRHVVGVVVVALAAAALSGCSLLESIIGGAPEGESDVFTLAVGDCLNDVDAPDEVTSVPVVSCDGPHDVEVFARTDTLTASFPGDLALFDELDAFCQGDVFTDFVGVPYADSMYGTSGYVPTQGSWDDGDRELLCTIGDPNGQTTGSLAGIGQ